jgi:hypothetical protein
LDQLIRSLCLPMAGESEGHRRSPEKKRAAEARWNPKTTRLRASG